MHVTEDESRLLAGAGGPLVGELLREQVQVGVFFHAADFVEVSHVHLTADYEVMGEAGLRLLERLVRERAYVAVPTTRNATCLDSVNAERLGQDEHLISRERAVTELLGSLGVEATNSCIVYQSHYLPRFGEHIAWGDTGTVAYANSVAGARTNYESGTAGLSAALTGRTPRYGYHLAAHRRGSVVVRVDHSLEDSADWGALGGLIGELVADYWTVPVIEMSGSSGRPTDDHLKHLSASLASFGSIAMFHLVGVTPECGSLEEALGGIRADRELRVNSGDFEQFYRRYSAVEMKPDLVVFTAPQLSCEELQRLGELLIGRCLAPRVTVIVTTDRACAEDHECSRWLDQLRKVGVIVLQGVCWYLMDPVAMRNRFGWRTVATNSAKLANIITAHGYSPVLLTTDECIDIACRSAEKS